MLRSHCSRDSQPSTTYQIWFAAARDVEDLAVRERSPADPVIDLSGPWPWLGLQSGFDALFPKGEVRYWKSRALAELTEEAIDEIADWAARRPTPLTDIIVWHHGGAMSRVDETATAYAEPVLYEPQHLAQGLAENANTRFAPA